MCCRTCLGNPVKVYTQTYSYINALVYVYIYKNIQHSQLCVVSTWESANSFPLVIVNHWRITTDGLKLVKHKVVSILCSQHSDSINTLTHPVNVNKVSTSIWTKPLKAISYYGLSLYLNFPNKTRIRASVCAFICPYRLYSYLWALQSDTPISGQWIVRHCCLSQGLPCVCLDRTSQGNTYTTAPSVMLHQATVKSRNLFQNASVGWNSASVRRLFAVRLTRWSNLKLMKR